MVKRVECRVISTVPTGGFNSRSGRSPEGSQSNLSASAGQVPEVSDAPSGPYNLFGSVSEGIMLDTLV